MLLGTSTHCGGVRELRVSCLWHIPKDTADTMSHARHYSADDTEQDETRGREKAMSYTPEPWKIGNRGMIYTDDLRVAIMEPCKDASIEEQAANAARIVSCVNGCQGLNPAAFRAVVEALTAIVARINDEFDNPALVKQGFLGLDSLEGMKRIAEHALATAQEST